VEACSELRGEKRVSLKPPMDARPQLHGHMKLIAQGSYHEMEPTLTRQEIGKHLLNKRLVTASGHTKEGA
jgi:hypothetical protein